MKKTKKILFMASFAMLFALSFAVLLNSCKKRNDETKTNGDTNVVNLVGKWCNEAKVGENGVVITTLDFKGDNTLHVTVDYSNLVKEEDNLDFTLPYEVKDNVLCIAYNYEDIGDSEYVDHFKDKFEIKGDDVLTFIDDPNDDTYSILDGIFFRTK